MKNHFILQKSLAFLYNYFGYWFFGFNFLIINYLISYNILENSSNYFLFEHIKQNPIQFLYILNINQ